MIKLLKGKMGKIISLALCLALALSIVPKAEFRAEAAKPESSRIIVSMGDSYSSGEGIEKFYDQDLPLSEKVKSADWIAHRSQESWGGQLTLPGVEGKMADEKNRNEHWYFVAASGARTKHIDGTYNRTYYKKALGEEEKNFPLPPQTDVFKQIAQKGEKADYVTITIGGNDVGFSEIVRKAAIGSGYLDLNGSIALAKMLLERCLDDKIVETLRKTYENIHSKSGARIIVAGYPTLFDEDGSGFPLTIYEARLINNAVRIFNLKIQRAVLEAELNSAEKDIYHFVSVEEGFKGYEAYTSDAYIHGIVVPAKEQDINEKGMNWFSSNYSVHPNKKGAEVYRRCVQEKINELERQTSDERDVVLVLDASGSMSGTPMEETRKASTKFIDTILKEDASLGIVTYENSAHRQSDFSMDEIALKRVVTDLRSGGGTNIEAGLREAREMLEVSSAKKKIIVLMSDGEPNDGIVGEELIEYANELKEEGIYIYTLGFFQSVGGRKGTAQDLMQRMASDGCHYEVPTAEDLVFFFGDIADQINGQKYIYVRIACPVDVKVSRDGETLSSTKGEAGTRTSFGSLTFEESSKEYEDSTDSRIKILRLKDNYKYNIEIEGNGRGSMDYTIGFMDENGEYSDLREFNDIKITKKTEIATVAANTSSTTMKVDSDGDGKYDKTYRAAANSVAEEVDYTYIYIIAGIVLALILALVLTTRIKRWKKRRAVADEKKKAAQKKFCTRCGATMTGVDLYCGVCGNKLR